jgi:hypothetical protein
LGIICERRLKGKIHSKLCAVSINPTYWRESHLKSFFIACNGSLLRTISQKSGTHYSSFYIGMSKNAFQKHEILFFLQKKRSALVRTRSWSFHFGTRSTFFGTLFFLKKTAVTFLERVLHHFFFWAFFIG